MRGVPRPLDGRLVLRAALVVVALPFLATFLSLMLAGQTAPLNHDVALIELRTGDVFGGDTPLVGSYERYGGNQPGPWLFWTLAVPSLIGSLGIAVATLLVGYASAAGSLWVAHRRGGSVLVLWTSLLIVWGVVGRGLDRLSDPWEPMISLLVIVLLVMLVWEVAVGTLRVLPVAVGVAWLLASMWTMLTPIVVCVGLVLAAAVAVRARAALRSEDRAERRGLIGSIVVSAGVLAVMVLPTIIEQVTTNPGNLTRLREAATASGATVGLSGAWRALRLQFEPWAPWMGRAMPLTLSSEVDGSRAFIVPVALLVWLASVATLAVTSRRLVLRDREVLAPTPVAADATTDSDAASPGVGPPDLLGSRCGLWWLHTGVGAVLAGVLVALSLSRGGVAVWSLQPAAAVAILVWLATGWTVVLLVLERRPVSWGARVTTGLSVGLVVVSVVASVVALRTDHGPGILPAAIGELADGVPSVVRPDFGPLLVTSDASVRQVFDTSDFGVAELAASLERRGYRTVVRADLVDKFGARRARPADVTGELRIESGDVVPDGAGWRLVRRVDPLDARQRRHRDRMDRAIDDAAGGAQGAALLHKAAADPHLAALLEESASVPEAPLLSLWYRLVR